MQNILDEAQEQMQQVAALVKDELAKINVGRARPALVEHLKVKVYESQMELRELASISSPDPAQLVVSPWDKSIIADIEKAILESNLHLQPSVDKEIIRIKIPPLTGERREELIKEIWQKVESGKVMLRQIRQEAKEKIEDQKGQPGVSEDDIFKELGELQKIVDEFQNKLEGLAKGKEEALCFHR